MSKSLQPTFVLSLDFELAWGLRGDPTYRADFERTREVIDSLLSLFEKYNISATWATVGELFIEGSHEQSDNYLWHAPETIKKIRECRVPQEIGSHSFSHKVVSEDCDRRIFEEELQKNEELTKENGLVMRSFVYPKNVVGFTELLPRYGFTSYRGVDRQWYKTFPKILQKICHVLDNYLCLPTKSVLPEKEGMIWNIPGSYFYVHARGWAKFLPKAFRVRKVLSGINHAVTNNGVFHLWFHPFNLASNPERLLSGLENVFVEVARLRDQGKLQVKTMGALVEKLESNG